MNLVGFVLEIKVAAGATLIPFVVEMKDAVVATAEHVWQATLESDCEPLVHAVCLVTHCVDDFLPTLETFREEQDDEAVTASYQTMNCLFEHDSFDLVALVTSSP